MGYAGGWLGSCSSKSSSTTPATGETRNTANQLSGSATSSNLLSNGLHKEMVGGNLRGKKNWGFGISEVSCWEIWPGSSLGQLVLWASHDTFRQAQRATP